MSEVPAVWTINRAHEWTHTGKEPLILKCVEANGESHNGFKWPLEVGAEVSAPDWNTENKCGGGLHGWPWGLGIGDGMRPKWAGRWIVFAPAPGSGIVGNLENRRKCKVEKAVIRFVGNWTEATRFVLAGQMALVFEASKTSATSGYSSTSATSGNSSTSATSGDYSTSATSGYSSTSATSGNSSTSATSGNYSTSATSGYSSTSATSGNSSTSATSGNYSTSATSGDYSTSATSGDYSTSATSGYSSTSATSGYSSTSATSGYYSTSATSGNSSTSATSGNSSTSATSGNYSTSATSGNYSTSATSGYSSTSATSGDSSKASASGEASAAVCSGLESRAKAGKFGCVALSWWNAGCNRREMRCREVGVGDGSDGKLKADVWYVLDGASGDFTEARQ